MTFPMRYPRAPTSFECNWSGIRGASLLSFDRQHDAAFPHTYMRLQNAFNG